MYHIIINPASRSGKGLKIWKHQIEPILHDRSISYRSYFSEKIGDVAHLVREVEKSEKERPIHLIILGGDGTVNEALQGMDDPSSFVLGYIPTGSSNDFARDLGISKEPAEALELILSTGTPKYMDLGKLVYDDGAERRFAVSCGIGYDAAVCAEALYSKIKVFCNKIGLGKLTYLGIALKQLISIKTTTATLTLDDDTTLRINKMLFISSMVHRYEGGGFKFCPDAVYDDGILNLCKVGGVPKPVVLVSLPSAFKGKHYRVKGIDPYKARTVQIETSAPMWVHTDGEVLRKCTRLSVSCLERAIQVIVPR